MALPIVTEAGEVLGTSTPAAKAPSPTAMPATAWEDEDTSAAPAVDAQVFAGWIWLGLLLERSFVALRRYFGLDPIHSIL